MSNTGEVTSDSLELSKMFHEIKNPLTFISSSLQLIEEEHPEVLDFRFWSQTMEDLKNLRNLVDELSTLQKGNTLNKTLINLFDFTEDLLESTAAYLLETGTPLTLDCDCFDLDFYADETKLRQAVVNLLKNAAESSPSGSPITLRVTTDAQMLRLEVSDQGCGISSENLRKIFEPFHTTKSYGTGLGLPIVKRIVDSHGGRLSINSKEGAGTTVRISLPLLQ